MNILLVGISHRTAPLATRERFAISGDEGGRLLRQLLDYMPYGVVVATCNRTEIYTLVKDPITAHQHICRFLADWSRIRDDELIRYLYIQQQEEAVRHLFRVASGLDSMIIGEEQILGQVRGAMEQAHSMGALGPVLSNLFRHALRVGKKARTQTAISRNSVSVSSAAVGLAKGFFGSLAPCRALIIGAGEAGGLAGRSLATQGVASITVTSRTHKRARELADQIGGATIPFNRLMDTVGDVDIIVSATGSLRFVLTAEDIRGAMARRPRQPLFIIDTAVPRDVDPEASKIENVFLRNIDDLQAIAEANLNERRKEAEKVEILVKGEGDKFMAWWRTLGVIPTITALRHKAEEIRRGEMTKTLGKLKGLSEREQTRIDAMTNAIIKKLLHHPLVYLKERGNTEDYTKAVQDLFDLHIDGESEARYL